MRLELGTPVRCSDAEFGTLADLVIDPASKRVTHLVVQPGHHGGEARLVPIELADPEGNGEIALRCSAEDAAKLEGVQEFAYLRLGEAPVEDPAWDVGVEEVLAQPYYPTGDLDAYTPTYSDKVGIAYDRVPKGEVEIRRTSPVTSGDGEFVGHVEGFVVDGDEHITHVVLERGHLWRKRDVSIPIGAVTEVVTDGVTVGLTVDEIGELPAVPVHRWPGHGAHH